jgi:glycosyltransferase involved in cell wall biosynthesis
LLESVVDDRTGPLVEPDDSAALAGAILQLIADRKKALTAMGAAGGRRARELFLKIKACS